MTRYSMTREMEVDVESYDDHQSINFELAHLVFTILLM